MTLSIHTKTIKRGACILVLPLIFACSSNGAEQRQNKYLTKAQTYYAEENYEKSRIEVKNVLQINPKNAQARLLLGNIHQNKGEYREAFGNFQAAIESDPQLLEAHLALAKIYLSATKNELANEYIDKALAINPANKDGRVLKAAIEIRLGNIENGESLALKVLSEFPGDPDTISILTPIYIDKTPKKSLDILRQGLALNPTNIKLKLTKIKVLTALGKENEIEGIYLELIKENPEILEFPLVLTERYERLGRLEEAEEIYQDTINDNKEINEPIFRYISFVARNYDTEKAINILKEFIEKRPDLYQLKSALANTYLELNKLEEAKKILTDVIRDYDDSTDTLKARNDLAKIALQENNVEEANRLLEEVFSIEANNAPSLILRAKMELIESNYKDAISNLRAALKNDDKSIEALLLLARAHEKTNSPSLAMDSYTRILELNSNQIEALMGASKINIYEKNIDQAKGLLLKVNKFMPLHIESAALLNRIYIPQGLWTEISEINQKLIDSNNPEIMSKGLILQAGVMRAQKKWPEATNMYHKALEIGPREYKALAGTIDSYLVDKQYDSAIALLKEHGEKHKDLEFVKPLLAHVYTISDKIGLAIKTHLEIISENPSNEGNYQKLASIYYSKNDFSETEKVYLKGISSNDKFIGLRVLLGNLYEKQSRYKESVLQYEAVLKIDPEFQVARNNLAAVLINEFPTTRNLTRALDLASVFSNSKTATYLDTLGWAHYHSDNIPQAISFFKAAIDIQNDPEFNYHLGAAYLKEGKMEQAKALLQLSVQDNTNNRKWQDSAKTLLGKL